MQKLITKKKQPYPMMRFSKKNYTAGQGLKEKILTNFF